MRRLGILLYARIDWPNSGDKLLVIEVFLNNLILMQQVNIKEALFEAYWHAILLLVT